MRVYKPRAELRPYVRYYWTLECDKPFSVLTFPIGCPQIIFHRKSPLNIPELGRSQSAFTISGQVNFPAHIQSYGHLEMIVAVFYPHTIGMFIDTPPSAFYNIEISGYDIGNRNLNDVAAKIFDCDSHTECIRILEERLLSKIRPSLNTSRAGTAVQMLLQKPSIPIEKLADAVCLGKKQHERIFREHVGMNPKEYARVVRFQKAMGLMQCGIRNYAGIAAKCGYSDQSHFIRDFKAMSGHTPKTLLRHCTPYSDLFSCPE